MTAKEQYLTGLTRRSEFTPGAAIKSDDVEGRTKIYESMVKGENTLEAGTPASFDVLTNEIRALGLNMQLEKKRV